MMVTIVVVVMVMAVVMMMIVIVTMVVVEFIKNIVTCNWLTTTGHSFIWFIRYIEALLDYLYDYTQRVLPLHDLEGVSSLSMLKFVCILNNYSPKSK